MLLHHAMAMLLVSLRMAIDKHIGRDKVLVLDNFQVVLWDFHIGTSA